MQERPKNTDELETVMGIGKKLAQNLRKRGIKNRGDLSKIFEELPLATKMDLKYKPNRKIPHECIVDIDSTMKKIFLKHKCKYLIAGSYRRLKPFSRDIDILVDKSCIKESDALIFITNMINKSRVRTPVKIKLVSPYSSGPDRISALFQLNEKVHYKVDFFIIPPKEWIPAVVYATGDQQFNIRMRAVAKHRGWKLNQRGLYDRNGKLIPVTSEKGLFNVLNMTYLEPHSRNM